jgi:hypothetical protein
VERGWGKIPIPAIIIIIIIIIIIHFPSQQCLADSQKSMGLTDQALVIHSSAQNILTVRNALNITALPIRIYRPGRRLSSLKRSSNLFRNNARCG